MDKQFKVGSVYRTQGGKVARLIVIADWHHREKWHGAFPDHLFAHAIEVPGSMSIAYVSLMTGRTVKCMDRDAHEYHLLTGELHCVNGEWVPISAEPAKTPETFAELVDAAGRAILRHLADIYPEAAPEPLRSPLDWNAPKPLDAFKGYEVTSGSSDPHAFAGSFGSPDLQKSAHQVAPMFGSAFLKD